jgi:DNA integrity scanning protein DisA with diadenylate cyclase activity
MQIKDAKFITIITIITNTRSKMGLQKAFSNIIHGFNFEIFNLKVLYSSLPAAKGYKHLELKAIHFVNSVFTIFSL